DAARGIAFLYRDDRFLGRLFGDRDLLAHQGYQHVLGILAAIGGQHFQPHRAALRSTDLVHDIVDAPADHVGQRTAGALAYRDDLVAHRKLAGTVGRAAGHHLADQRVVVVLLQHRADAVQRQLHRDVEIGRGPRAEIIAVRVDRHRVRVHVGLEHVLRIELVYAIEVIGVALGQRLADVVVLLAGQFQTDPVVLDALAPDVVERGAVLGPGRLVAVR